MIAWELFWDVYQDSGPALQVVLIGLLTYIWRVRIQPRLDRLEETQSAHADDLQDKALDHRERDVLLSQAHNRLDNAKQARESLRKRIRRVERRVDQDHTIRDDEMDRKLGERQPGDD